MGKPRTVAGATSILLGKYDEGTFGEEKLGHVMNVILALCENPDSVTINTSLLNQVWARLNWYIKIEKKGFLLVLLSADHWKKREKVRTTISELGVSSELIHVMQPALSMKNAQGTVVSRDCRLILYSKECPKVVLEQIPPEISVKFKNLHPNSIHRALVDLSKKLDT